MKKLGTFREWLNEKERKEGKEAYKDFFNKKLEKYGVKSATELSGEDKKKFFDEVDAEWEGENEEPEVGDVNESKEMDINVLSDVMDKFNKSIQKAIKENKLMEIDSELHSLKKSIDAWIPVIQDKIKSK